MIKTMNPSFYLHAGDTIVAGVSGGPDSTAMLRLLVECAKTTPIKIVVAHVNHGIRGENALRDETFVRKLAEKCGCIFQCKRVHLKGKSGVEEKGREVRRTFFELLAKKYRAARILTAHTQDDQVETIVFNFLRGSGARGLAGMNRETPSVSQPKIIYLKPLLDVSKKELLGYLKRIRQPFCKDETNEDTSLSRNFIRKKILPMFQKINPGFRSAILRNREIFYELNVWLIQEAYEFIKAKKSLSAKEFNRLPLSLKTTIIQELYRTASKKPYGLPMQNVKRVLELVSRNIGNKRIICHGGVSFVLHGGMLKVEHA